MTRPLETGARDLMFTARISDEDRKLMEEGRMQKRDRSAAAYVRRLVREDVAKQRRTQSKGNG